MKYAASVQTLVVGDRLGVGATLGEVVVTGQGLGAGGPRQRAVRLLYLRRRARSVS